MVGRDVHRWADRGPGRSRRRAAGRERSRRAGRVRARRRCAGRRAGRAERPAARRGNRPGPRAQRRRPGRRPRRGRAGLAAEVRRMSPVDSVVEDVERAAEVDAGGPAYPPAETPTQRTRWPLRRIINVSVGALALFCLAAVTIGTFALADLADARARVVERIDPALQQAQRLEAALVNQETGVRGSPLGAERDLLEPYPLGLADERDAVARLEPELDGFPEAARALRETIDRADNWRVSYAEPAIA